MSGSGVADENENGREKLDPPAMPSKAWYRRKWVWVIGVLLVLAVSVPISVYQYIQYRTQYQYRFHRPIEVTRGPWQVLDPGKPVEPLKFEVVEEGTGVMVEPGDLIQVSLWWWSNKENKLEQRNDDYWIWVGFRTEKETPFHSISPRLVSAFAGLKEGADVKFLESPSQSIYAGHVYLNPFGDSGYSRRRDARGKSSESRMIYVPYISGYTIVHIKKVFKGQLKYRTIHLYDGTWYESCRWWGGEGRAVGCEVIKNDPRESWRDEARYDGVSADGQRATFQYGPVAVPGRPSAGHESFEQLLTWSKNEWAKLPVGVQVE